MITKRILAGLIAAAALLLIPVVSFSEVSCQALDPISEGLRFPEDVAVSPDGTIYVVDGSKGRVLIYDNEGKSAGSISIEKPTCVAVNSNGNIYIGTNKDLSVRILDSSLKTIGALGIGAGEFKLPKNIAIDETGNVYVVDQLDNFIKVYKPDGTFITKIDDYPNLPQDVTIMNNEIYVIDHPLIADQNGGTAHGAGVSVFDRSGKQTRTFDYYGTGEGQLFRPGGITSDGQGILYITDSFHGEVLCFDGKGNCLGKIQDPVRPMSTPMGIAPGADGRLFVASLYTSSINIFGLEGNGKQVQ